MNRLEQEHYTDHNAERGYAINDAIEKFDADKWREVEEEADSEMMCDGSLVSGLVWSIVRLKPHIDRMVSDGSFNRVKAPDDAIALQDFLRNLEQADELRTKYARELVEAEWERSYREADEARGES